MINNIFKVYVLVGVVALFLLTCATLPVGFESLDEAVVRHTHSGMEFPPKVSGFDRINPTAYDSEGLDVSVGYVLFHPKKCNITFYIYPATAGLEEHVVEIKNQIETYHKDAVLISESETAHEHSGVTHTGKELIYTFREIYSVPTLFGVGYREQDVESRAYLYVYKDWYMKYRITYSQEFQDEIDIYLSSFMKRLVWP